MNQDKQCRSPFIVVSEDGTCEVCLNNGPFGVKSATENYVELRECKCFACDRWELDEASGFGACSLHGDLFFDVRRAAEDIPEAPKCSEYDKQIEPPGFAAHLE